MYSSLTTSSNELTSSPANSISSSNNNNSNQTTQSQSNSSGQQGTRNSNFSWSNQADALNEQQAASNTLLSSSSLSSNAKNNQNNNAKQLTFHKGLRLYNEGCVHDVLQVGFNLSGLISIKVYPSAQSTSNQSKIRGNQSASSNQIHAGPNNNNVVGGVAAAAAAAALMAAGNNLENQLPAGLVDRDHHNHHHHNHNHQGNNSNSTTTSIINNHDISSPKPIKHYRVSTTFDRCKITSVSCSCELQDIFWCEHVVALILYRIRNPKTIDLRVPISETLLSLDRQQLQKLVQYIIAEHHTEVLPTAQRLLDDMSKSYSQINQIQGAPDPTAGACADDEHIWHLDENQVNEKVQNYLNFICTNTNNPKEATRQIHALFEKIREMFKAKDSNGTRMLKLITEQFLSFATKNEKSRPLWDQLISLWVIVMLNPDLPKIDKASFLQLLMQWSRVTKCPKEDVERRPITKRKAADLSDDEDGDDYASMNPFCNDYPNVYNQSNNYPAHMATHGYRALHPVVPNNAIPVLKSFNQLPMLPSTCPYQLSHQISKKLKTIETHNSPNRNASTSYKQSSSSSSYSHNNYHHHHHHHHNQMSSSRNTTSAQNPVGPQEPRSVFYRAIDLRDATWDEPHLQLILNRDGPFNYDAPQKMYLFDYTGNPLWNETVSQAAARIETLKTFGHRDQALRLTVATVRRLKLQQDQWCLAASTDPNMEYPCFSKGLENYAEGWIGHPFDPINVMLDILLDSSLTQVAGTNLIGSMRSNSSLANNSLCTMNSSRCSCVYNQTIAEFNLLPDFSLSHQHRASAFPMLPIVNLAPRRLTSASNHVNDDRTIYYHVPVPGCCQKGSYLTLAVEIALIALGQLRSIPTIATAHDRAVRQEQEIIRKLESIDTDDPLLIDILKHQATLLLGGGPFQNSCCGIPTDSAPLHTYARYLFDSLVVHCPQLAYKVGVYALKMPLLLDENNENFGAARTSPRTINYSHLQSEQLALAQTMLSKAKDEVSCLRKVYRASVKNIRNPASLLRLSKYVLKEAKPDKGVTHQTLLKTSFDLGLQVLKSTLPPNTSNGKTRKEAILNIVDSATEIGPEAIKQVMKDARGYFSATEALNLVIENKCENSSIRAQAKLKFTDNMMAEIDCRSRDLVLECASRDPTNCALEALKFCETDEESLKKALNIVIDAGKNGSMDSTQLIKVADYVHDRGMIEKAFAIAMVAVDSLTIPPNSDNSSSKKDIFSACAYAQKVPNGFSLLIPKLIDNIECAAVLSEIYHKYCPDTPLAPTYRNCNFGSLDYNDFLYRLKPEMNIYSHNIEQYKQKVEDAKWWDALLKRTLKAFVDTTRTRLQNISPRHYGEFIEFLVKAQGTFHKAADGPQQFKDLISEIQKSYRTKKKLMERLKSRLG